MSSVRLDALVLNLESRGGLYLIRALARDGYRAAAATWDTCAAAPGMRTRRATVKALFPDPDEGLESTAAAIAAWLDEQRADVVVACTESALVTLHRSRELLGARAALAIGSADAVEATLSKPATLEIASDLGIAAPRAVLVTSPEEVTAAAAEVGLPAVLKPERGWRPVGERFRWTKGVYVASIAELEEAARTTLADGTPALLQEYVTGARELEIRFTDRGRTLLRGAIAVSRMWPDIGVSVMRHTIVPHEDTGAHADRLVAALGLDGYAQVEFRRDERGRALLMEVNGRPTVGSPEVFDRAGVPIAAMIVDWARGRRVEPVSRYTIGLRVGWLGGDLRLLAAAARVIETSPRPSVGPVLRELASDYIWRRARMENLDLRDPAPLLAVVAGAGRQVASAIGARGRRRRFDGTAA